MPTITSNDLDVERGFLSCVSKSTECLDEAISMGINLDWFSDSFHQKVWSLILEHKDSDVIDIDVMIAFKDPEDRSQVRDVFDACETSAGFGSFVDALRESYIKSNLRRISHKINDSLAENQQSRVLY